MFEVESPSPVLVSAATDFLEAWDLYLEADGLPAPVDDPEGPVDVEAWTRWYARREEFLPGVEGKAAALYRLEPSLGLLRLPELAEFARGVVNNSQGSGGPAGKGRMSSTESTKPTSSLSDDDVEGFVEAAKKLGEKVAPKKGDDAKAVRRDLKGAQPGGFMGFRPDGRFGFLRGVAE